MQLQTALRPATAVLVRPRAVDAAVISPRRIPAAPLEAVHAASVAGPGPTKRAPARRVQLLLEDPHVVAPETWKKPLGALAATTPILPRPLNQGVVVARRLPAPAVVARRPIRADHRPTPGHPETETAPVPPIETPILLTNQPTASLSLKEAVPVKKGLLTPVDVPT